MPRDLKAHENQKRMRARRDHALSRLDLREPSVPREAAAGPTSHSVKKVDPDTAAAIAAFLRNRKP
jgi:hypothetical protein